MFPFVEIVGSDDIPQENLDGFSDMMDFTSNDAPYSNFSKKQKKKEIDFSGKPINLLAERGPKSLNFLNNRDVNISLIHLAGCSFRLVLRNQDENLGGGALYLELEYDQLAFDKEFALKTTFNQQGVEIKLKEGELCFPSVVMTTNNFINKITPVIKDYQSYLERLFN